jgi:2-amino-4-hydroxy-6-hydroxymethyldihydropteridine diphosphokinase
MSIWQPAYIGLGSNLDDPRAQVLRAAEALATLPHTLLVLRSPLYGSRPFGPVTQPDYVNAVAGVLTQLTARALFKEIKALERAAGRKEPHERWGPRILDLDLLVHGRDRLDEADLTVPHPGIVERNFVLYPLADIAPDLDVPGVGRVIELQRRVSPEGIWALDQTAPSTQPSKTVPGK